MTTIKPRRKDATNGDAVQNSCAGYQTRSLFFSDPETIKPAPQTHKPADSGVVVGNDARRCSLEEVTVGVFKRGRGN
jgi:hypothetical protein